MPPRDRLFILLLEDDPDFADIVGEELRSRGHDVTHTNSVQDARERVKDDRFDVALLDLQLPDGSGLDVLRDISTERLPIEALVLTGHAEVPTALEAMRLGAYDYLPKSSGFEELHVLLGKAAEKGRLRRENSAFRARLRRDEPVAGFVTQDGPTRQVLTDLSRAAGSV